MLQSQNPGESTRGICRSTHSRLIASIRSLVDDHKAIPASHSLHTIEQKYNPRKNNAQWLRGSGKLFSLKLLGLLQKLQLRKMGTEMTPQSESQPKLFCVQIQLKIHFKSLNFSKQMVAVVCVSGSIITHSNMCEDGRRQLLYISRCLYAGSDSV